MTTQKKILIVDDQPLNIDILKNGLPNYEKMVVSSGKAALVAVRSKPPPDLILLEVVPHM